MPELIYLACPYSDADPLVEDARYQLVTKVAGALIVETACEVFSPVTHSHHISRAAARYAIERAEDPWVPTYDFWLAFDYHMLDIADWLYVLKLEGWEQSKGIEAEIKRFVWEGNRYVQRRLRANHSIKYIKWEDYT
jgi:hypothetical protein